MIFLAFSQIRICRPFPLNFDLVFMKDAECAETNEKSIFRLLFFELSWKFIEKWGDLRTKMTITRKMKIGKIWNLIFHVNLKICIFHVNLNTFENKKNWNFFLEKINVDAYLKHLVSNMPIAASLFDSNASKSSH